MFGRFRKRKKKIEYSWDRPSEYTVKGKSKGKISTAYIHVYYANDVIVVDNEVKFKILKIKVRARIMKSSASTETEMVQQTWIINPTKVAAQRCLLAVADWLIQQSLPAGKAHDICGEALYSLEIDL